MTCIPLRRGEDTEGPTATQEGSPCEDGAEIVVMLPQTKGDQEPPEGARSKEGLSPRASRESMALPTP